MNKSNHFKSPDVIQYGVFLRSRLHTQSQRMQELVVSWKGKYQREIKGWRSVRGRDRVSELVSGVPLQETTVREEAEVEGAVG